MIVFAVPTIPPRAVLLQRALDSIAAQTWPVDYVAVQMDETRSGASATRNLALRDAMDHLTGDLSESWVGFLDDDDELLPHHCEYLIGNAQAANVGVAIGWYECVGGQNPFPKEFRGRTYDPDAPHCTPISYIARADLMQQVMWSIGGFREDVAHLGIWQQDEQVLSALVRLGGHVSLTDVSWRWHHDTPGGNTSGIPDNVKW